MIWGVLFAFVRIRTLRIAAHGYMNAKLIVFGCPILLITIMDFEKNVYIIYGTFHLSFCQLPPIVIYNSLYKC